SWAARSSPFGGRFSLGVRMSREAKASISSAWALTQASIARPVSGGSCGAPAILHTPFTGSPHVNAAVAKRRLALEGEQGTPARPVIEALDVGRADPRGVDEDRTPGDGPVRAPPSDGRLSDDHP